jgi:sigma-B regulation protein RsbU (phosphoserine phosphatase)
MQILMVEDSAEDAALLLAELKRKGYVTEHRRVESKADFLAALQSGSWDAVIADYVLPQFSGPEALQLLREQGPDLPFLMVSGVRGEEEAVAMMKAGANDYLMKGNLSRLVPALERELESAQARRQHKRAVGAMQYLAAIVESSEDAIYGKNLNGVIVSWNPAAERLFGYSAEEIIGQSVLQLFPKHRRDEMLDILGGVRRGETMGIQETERRHKSGEIIPVSVTVSPIKSESGEIIGASSIARDISQQKQTEFEKQELIERLYANGERFRTADDEYYEPEMPRREPPADDLPRFAGVAFPKLKDSQFAGLCSEGWNVFESQASARAYASQWVAKQPAEEYQIYNARRQLVNTVVCAQHLQGAGKVQRHKPWWKFWE